MKGRRVIQVERPPDLQSRGAVREPRLGAARDAPFEGWAARPASLGERLAEPTRTSVAGGVPGAKAPRTNTVAAARRVLGWEGETEPLTGRYEPGAPLTL